MQCIPPSFSSLHTTFSFMQSRVDFIYSVRFFFFVFSYESNFCYVNSETKEKKKTRKI